MSDLRETLRDSWWMVVVLVAALGAAIALAFKQYG